jgi:flagellar biosynthesis/type III secretory pathway protein FliH
VADKPIIARARPAGTRRLTPVPAPAPGGGAPLPGGGAVTVGKPTGLTAFLEMAQRQGAELVASARAQADGIADNARREGFEAGYAEGKAAAEREAHDLLHFAENAVREAVESRSRLIAESEEALVRLAVDVAERIVKADLQLHPERVLNVLEGALRKAFVRDRLTVVCNPADLALIEEGQDALATQVGTLQHLELIGDRRVQRGGVVVRTDAGDVDATLDSQLERLCEAMLARGDG